MKIKYLNFPSICVLGIIIVLLHILFLILGNYYYYKIWWADTLLHTSGGFLTGLFVLWYLFNYSALPFEKQKIPLYIIIIAVLSFTALIGVFWEFYEFILDKITGYKSYSAAVMQANLADTMSDLLFDLIGAAASNIFLKFKTYDVKYNKFKS